MNAFIALAALLTLLIIVWMLRPLLRKNNQTGVSGEQLNTALHRDQLQALKTDLERGLISQQDYESSVDELQLRLLDDTDSYQAEKPVKTNTFWSGRRTAWVMALSFPLFSGLLYMKLGNPEAIDPIAKAQVTEQQIQQMVDTLAAKLQAKPDNPKGWAMLAKSYKVMGRFDESRQAFERIGPTLNTDPELLVDYADVLAVLANNQLEGKPMELVNKALAIQPKHPMGLMMSGVAAFRRGDYKLAIAQWEILLTMLQPGSADAQQIEENIAAAQSKAGITPTRSVAGNAAPQTDNNPGGVSPDMINQMVERLAKRLENNPDDIQGWARLGRAYKVQKRMQESVKAYSKAGSLLDSDADVITQYADAMATLNNSLQGEPMKLVSKALALNPKHPTALMMAGQYAYQQADYARAIAHWETVLSVLPAQSPDVDLVRSEIADAKAHLAKKP
jgi:cytochrome c-type biogenesis protein CcmH